MAVTVGFLGFGNMAQAMADGFLKAGALEGRAMCACAKRWERLQSTAGARGMVPCRDSREVAERSQVVGGGGEALSDGRGAHPGEGGPWGESAHLRGGGVEL